MILFAENQEKYHSLYRTTNQAITFYFRCKNDTLILFLRKKLLRVWALGIAEQHNAYPRLRIDIAPHGLLHFLHDFLHRLALLLTTRTILGDMTHWHDDHWLETLAMEMLADDGRVEGAYPAGA